MILVLGLDAATWTVIRPNLNRLPNIKKIMNMGVSTELVLREKPISPLIWCGMFCGKTFEEHGHDSFVKDNKLLKRGDIKVDFIWDILHRNGKSVKVLNVPFIVPPYSFNVDFKPISFGLPSNEKDWQEELERVTDKVSELLDIKPDVIIAVYSLLDRIQHFHWGEDMVVDWYEKVDDYLGRLVFGSGFLDGAGNKLIIISDHGFCSFGEAKVQTLPQKTDEGTLKGDHHENAVLITVNVKREINSPQDVFYTILEEYAG